MKKYYISLRLQKLYWNLVNKIFYKDWPIEIMYADISEYYDLPKDRNILAEFNLKERHYLILEK